MLHKPYFISTNYETSIIEYVAYSCFKQQIHNERNDAHAYEMQNAICGSKTRGVLQPSSLIKISSRDLESIPFIIESGIVVP
jgi:hypothetical protein